jgi:hypothetical protein
MRAFEVRAVVRSVLAAALALTSLSAQGFDVVDAQFEVGKFYHKRDPMGPKYTLIREGHKPYNRDDKLESDETWNHQVGLRLDTDLFRFRNVAMYWDQELVGQTTTHQYRRIYWDFEVGFSWLNNRFHTLWNHRSDHLLDKDYSKYPLHDVYGIRVCLLKRCPR